jgi:F-type H+-transporting ATPase subunit delta
MLADRFAEAFIELSGTNVEEGLEAFKAMLFGLEHIKGDVSGTDAAFLIEKTLRNAVQKTNTASAGTEIAVRTLVLLVRKGLFKKSGVLAAEIKQELDRRNGIVLATLETLVPPDAEFEETLRNAIKQKTGAKQVTLRAGIVPDLLGGYRLRIGNKTMDASLRSLLQQMAHYLADASLQNTTLPSGGIS